MEILRDPAAETSCVTSANDMSKRRIDFLGLRFDAGSIDGVIEDIFANESREFRYIVTPNVHHMVRMLEDPIALRPLYERAWRVFCDSRVLSRLARIGGLELPVVTGSDLSAALIARAAERGLSIAVIGPTKAACARLQEKYPGLRVLSHTPKMGFIHSELEIRKCVDFVIGARAPLVFLAVGRPQQEILAGRIADHPQARGIGLCVGASIDFLTGAQRRAPVWVQKAGLEWAHRLLSDPRRFARRYLLESPLIFYFVCVEWKNGMPGLRLPGRIRPGSYASEMGRRRIAAFGSGDIRQPAGAGADLASVGNAKSSKSPRSGRP